MSVLSKKKEGKNIVNLLIDNALYLIIAILIIVIASFDFSFFNIASFTTILSQASTRIIFAIGVGGIIVLGGTDLSLGRAVGLAGVLSASLLQAADYSMKVYEFGPLPVIVPVLLAMAICAVFSLLQGFVENAVDVFDRLGGKRVVCLLRVAQAVVKALDCVGSELLQAERTKAGF